MKSSLLLLSLVLLPCLLGDTVPCVGYLVSGAGNSDVDGCYTPRKPSTCSCSHEGCFALDDTHQLYAWAGTWHLGDCNHHGATWYFETHKAGQPPESAIGCGAWTNTHLNHTLAAAPCPAVRRSNLPPPPSPAPQPIAPPPAPPSPPMRLVFADDFNGSEVNTSLWNVLTAVNSLPSNVFVRDGTLVLQANMYNTTTNGTTLHFARGGAVNTAKRFFQKQGRWVARVKLPRIADSGGYILHSSIWLAAQQTNGSSGSLPNISHCSQEIDIVEQYVSGHGPESTALAHVAGFAGSRKCGCTGGWMHSQLADGTRTTFGRTADFTSYWTTWRLDWTENWIAMSINDTVYSSYYCPIRNGTVAAGCNIPNMQDPMYLWLSSSPLKYRAQVGPGDVFPLEYLVDYVRIYQWV